MECRRGMVEYRFGGFMVGHESPCRLLDCSSDVTARLVVWLAYFVHANGRPGVGCLLGCLHLDDCCDEERRGPLRRLDLCI